MLASADAVLQLDASHPFMMRKQLLQDASLPLSPSSPIAPLATQLSSHLAAFARAVADDPARAGPSDSTTTPRRLQDSCLETCSYAGDGECDDGGPGAEFTDCAL
eukprot:6048020-Prymnesium_polylepis.1